MPLRKLLLAPEEAGYSAAPGAAARRLEVEGGRGRHRLDQIGAPSRVDAQWLCDPMEHNYLLAFYRTMLAEGAGPFLIDLILDGLLLTEREARFLRGSMALLGQSGESYKVGATLEVTPIERDAEADMDLVETFAMPVGGLPVMALTPGSADYSMARGDEIRQIGYGLGPLGLAPGYANSAALVRVSWSVSPLRYQYLVAFYYTAIAEAALPFRVPLVIDRDEPDDYVALMIPGTFALEGVAGATYTVGAELEVAPLNRDPTFDAAVLAAFPDAP
jgi:hypothetical protein